MSSYFDRTGAEAYLPPAIRTRDDFAALVAECEADLINQYTRRHRTTARTGLLGIAGGRIETGRENLTESDTREVYLRYYHADADEVDATDADEAAFLKAMGLELQRLIRWRAGQRSEDGEDLTGIEEVQRGRRSTRYNARSRARDSQYPQGFGSFLRPFDLRERVYAV